MNEFSPRRVNVNEMSMVTRVPGVTIQGVLERFPEGKMKGWGCESKGYSPVEVGFVHVPTGLELYAYARWGVVRVGCRVDERTDAESIAQDLASELQLVHQLDRCLPQREWR
jgi:hypothetical protein